ncbi:Uncharacterized protein APZ42_013372 [Daphnia magna]|uniref:Uncharacterized protein n=1 Tax=Daphnia magna TaxID=35525 RepID=A0A162QY09_9CRUS|nr:Uncharacterized protein APZ42_013372 [Daphnia magna]
MYDHFSNGKCSKKYRVFGFSLGGGKRHAMEVSFSSTGYRVERPSRKTKPKKNCFMEGKKWSATVTHGIQPATVPTVHYEGEEVSCWQREKTCN